MQQARKGWGKFKEKGKDQDICTSYRCILKILLKDASLTYQLCFKQMPTLFLIHPGLLRWWIMNANNALAEMCAQMYTVKAKQ